MSQLPPSVIWFAITIFITISFGLHLAHIYGLGFDRYEDRIVRTHNLPRNEAHKRVRFQVIFNWVILIISAPTAAYFAVISIINLLNGK